MQARMSMSVDTMWGNTIALSVESELDNGHTLSIGEIAKLQVFTLSLMHAEVRRENERILNIKDPDHHETRVEEMDKARTGGL